MSLYDDLGLDGIREKAEQVAGWSSSIKLLQSQMQLKKTSQIQQFSQPRREQHRKTGTVLAPVIDLKKNRREDEEPKNSGFGTYSSSSKESRNSSVILPKNQISPPIVSNEQEWIWEDEYDPMWPNDYEKVVKELRDKQDREREKEEEERKRKNKEDRERKSRESLRNRYDEDRRKAGFAGRPESDEEEDEPPKQVRAGGVAIAPPPSLQENSQNDSPKRPSFSGESFGMMGGSSVAAKIMAKYGFKEGQGLGKKEQGIAMALQVEKTSKRGGRIISDKEAMMVSNTMPAGPDSPVANTGPSLSPPPPPIPNLFNAMPPPAALPEKPEPSITEMMRNPSKVVLLRNMVGPGEVDEDLEPEVKDECNTKYGDVIRVIIYEQPNVPAEEAVRIFVEFKRIEAAIKAVVDLNGRFFGGRQVKAGFYSWEKLNNLELL